MVNRLMATEHSNTTADQKEKPGTHYLQPESVVQTYGDFPEDVSESLEYLLLTFSPSSLPLKQRWRTNGLSADFVADYLTTFLPNAEATPEAVAKRAEIQSAISYITNELLENAMKFSDANSPQPISIRLQLYLDHLVFCVTNSIDARGIHKYQSFIQEAIASDPSELLLQRLEQDESDSYQSSGLGLLTILSDYLARLGWKFETVYTNQASTTVTTIVQITL